MFGTVGEGGYFGQAIKTIFILFFVAIFCSLSSINASCLFSKLFYVAY